MGCGKLQIWITSESEPCRISERDEHDHTPWVVGIWHCDGSVLRWCGKSYFNMVANCGHWEGNIPPGTYVIRAADSMRPIPGGIWGNHWTDHAVVTVCCDEPTCVTLFAPSAHSCGWGFLGALNVLMQGGLIKEDVGKPAIAAVEKILKEIPRSKWDTAALPQFDQLSHAARDLGNKKG